MQQIFARNGIHVIIDNKAVSCSFVFHCFSAIYKGRFYNYARNRIRFKGNKARIGILNLTLIRADFSERFLHILYIYAYIPACSGR